MKILDRIFGRKANELTYDQVADLIDGRGGRSVAGVTVTEKTALQTSTVLACVKAISDGCATPDLHVYRELKDGTRQKATNKAKLTTKNSLRRLLESNIKPNGQKK